MAKIITTSQHKGGTGKTSTCVNLGASLAELGKSVLLVDLDPQASMSIHTGINPVDLEYSMHHVMEDSAISIDKIIKESEVPNLSIAPSDITLALVEVQLASHIGREKVLHKKLLPIADQYDYIILDSPPSLGLLTVNCLAAADEASKKYRDDDFEVEAIQEEGKYYVFTRRVVKEVVVEGQPI